MATDRTKALLLEHEQFAQLDVDEQRRRIAEYIADWYDPDCKLNTVDNVRFSQRLRSHAVKACISPGQALEIILPQARKGYEAAVYRREEARILAEDRQEEPITPTPDQVTPGCVSTQALTTDSTVEPATREPVVAHRVRSKPRTRP
jgi:hypothetical protein